MCRVLSLLQHFAYPVSTADLPRSCTMRVVTARKTTMNRTCFQKTIRVSTLTLTPALDLTCLLVHPLEMVTSPTLNTVHRLNPPLISPSLPHDVRAWSSDVVTTNANVVFQQVGHAMSLIIGETATSVLPQSRQRARVKNVKYLQRLLV